MADKPKKLCFVIGPLDNPEYEDGASKWLMTKVISPVIKSHFPAFKIQRSLSQEGETSPKTLNILKSADLVIADVTKSYADTLYQVGIRNSTRRPLVNVVVGPSEFNVINLSHIRLDRYTEAYQEVDLNGPREYLRVAITRSLEEFKHTSSASSFDLTRNVGQLADRIDIIADSLSLLRINSLDDQITQLREISRQVRSLSPTKRAASIENITIKALRIISTLFDVLGSKKGAQVIIAGATAGILGSSGWPTAEIFTITLAAWHGKEAFLAAVKKFGGRR
jgi:hypothetical protein